MNYELPNLRVRTLTPEATAQYEEAKEKFVVDLHAQWVIVTQLIKSFSPSMSQIDYFNNLELDISKAYSDLCATSSSYMSFLTRIRSKQSIETSQEHSKEITKCKEIVDGIIDKIATARQRAFETMSRHSKSSKSSRTSKQTSELSRKRAKAEAANLNVTFAVQEATIMKEKAALEEQEAKAKAEMARKKAEYEADLKLLASKQEAAVAQAEAEALDGEHESNMSQLRNLERLEISKPLDSMERTSKYVEDQSTINRLNVDAKSFQPANVPLSQDLGLQKQTNEPITGELIARTYVNPKINDTQHIQTSAVPSHVQSHPIGFHIDHSRANVDYHASSQIQDMTKFLLKKDLLISRLSYFNDKPENYPFWKAQFTGIMKELDANPIEELDLLSKWLRPQSSKYLLSIRSSNLHNPERALTVIWNRLDERYGSPELLESVIRSKLTNFPRITGKDNSRYYELLDILCEIESLMSDRQYTSLLSYFNSSSGVNPIINKLPSSVQEKWTSHAYRYKTTHYVSFPPFSCLVGFIRDLSRMKNDPGLSYVSESTSHTSYGEKAHEKDRFGKSRRQQVSVHKTNIGQEDKKPAQVDKLCPLHKTKHSLDDCRAFKEKSFDDRKKFLREHGICFRCCASDQHTANKCTQRTVCEICSSDKHASAMHIDGKAHGEEINNNSNKKSVDTVSACTQICKGQFSGRSCAKIVLVNLSRSDRPDDTMKAYAILDDQSNRSLVSPNVFQSLNIKAESTEYKITSCAGILDTAGRETHNLVVSSYDGTSSLTIPTVIECNHIPNMRDEIPTQEAARYHRHLSDLEKHIPPLHDDVSISILIGRDVPQAHHVLDQRIGDRNAPYAQKTSLGWVIVGEVCLHKVHPRNSVTINKTVILPNGRSSICEPCPNNISIEKFNTNQDDIVKSPSYIPRNLNDSVFLKNKDDEEIGMSIEDKTFLKTMDDNVARNSEGNWEAPLPFKPDRPRLPNNRSYAYKRAQNLDKNLQRDEFKREHFMTFMQKVLDNNHAEIAPPLSDQEECWYLPMFGVYHPRKPSQIRAVFDSSARYENISLNDVLMSGPDMNNKLLGVLLRFRKGAVAVTADIESMFHCFVVKNEHRRFLRFFWYRDNDFSKGLVEYQMRVHVFGNCPSPAVAAYCLRKAAEVNADIYGDDVMKFVNRNFYVDDGLISLSTPAEATDLIQRTIDSLRTGGNLRLHKIASNSKEVVDSFDASERAKNLKDVDLTIDELPAQQSLGLNWDLRSDTFTYNISTEERPYTRRGLLSSINGIYDPLGMVAPVVVTGKLILREIAKGSCDWDEPLSETLFSTWSSWRDSLNALGDLKVQRTYSSSPLCDSVRKELHLYSDASEQAIAAVAFLKTKYTDNHCNVGFVLGKAKVAPAHGHTVPRLELCAAVLAVQIFEIINRELDLDIDDVRFFTDSKVVLGYIHNTSKRFFKYVENRVERIRKSTNPYQWMYVPTNQNPADVATRPTLAKTLHNSKWIYGSPQLYEEINEICESHYPIIDAESDKEVKHDVSANAMKCETNTSDNTKNFLKFSHRIESFSVWKRLIQTIDLLRSIAQKYGKTCASVPMSEPKLTSEELIIRTIQHEFFATEIECIINRKPLSRQSSILDLRPFFDSKGILRIGGRICRSDIEFQEKHPIIIPKKCHLAVLLVRHFHDSVKHQGRHYTAGALRSGGYWIVGEKRLIASILHKCVHCRKLRGKHVTQVMSDLPEDRLKPTPPFTCVGIDTFGPWNIIARKTRGGHLNCKRWAVLFTCLYSRAVHIEVIEELSTSSFINCLRRFISIRGSVKEVRSDRGTNFIGATDSLNANVLHVEKGPIKHFLSDNKITWIFNSPHSSHMGGVWERMIGSAKRILDSMLKDTYCKHLTHEVLTTLMAEICAILNARPIVAVSTDPESPNILSPNMLLTQKTKHLEQVFGPYDIKDLYKNQWRCVQHLANAFWVKWRKEYLQQLQSRRKWQKETPDLSVGDIVLMKDSSVSRNEWPMGIVTNAIKSVDNKVRKVEVKTVRDGSSSTYTRPITDIVLLIHD